MCHLNTAPPTAAGDHGPAREQLAGHRGAASHLRWVGESRPRGPNSIPIIAVLRQAQPNGGWHQREMQDLAIAQLDQTMREFNVDPSRQYLTGFSMGGAGVYRFAYRWADRFAAIVAIAGHVQSPPPTSAAYRPERNEADRQSNAFIAASDPFGAVTQRIAHTPMWIFHGAADEAVPVEQSRRLVPALKSAGADVRYTEYPNTDHVGGAQQAYADPEMMTWLLVQRRK
jgi:predicted peptidase